MMQRSISALSGSLIWKDFPNTRLIIMNREKALNALNFDMMKALKRAYIHEPHPKGNSTLFVIKGAGTKSFCAGGDVVSVTTDRELAKEFFYDEYQMNHHILTMQNPQVSLWNGYVMGGGAGVSVHGRYRVASEKTIFAMPETTIGLFPDVGASWFLPRLKMKEFGLYLGVTGARLKGSDLAHVGLATHYVPSTLFDKLEERLCNIEDPANVEVCLNEFAVKELPPFTLEKHRKTLQNAFTLKETTTVESIMEALASDGSEFAKETLEAMSKLSPTSLRLALEMQRRGSKAKVPAEVFNFDYLGAMRACATSEFPEGVRALLIDKTKDPKWNPAKLEDVTAEHIEQYFKPVTPESRKWHPTDPY